MLECPARSRTTLKINAGSEQMRHERVPELVSREAHVRGLADSQHDLAHRGDRERLLAIERRKEFGCNRANPIALPEVSTKNPVEVRIDIDEAGLPAVRAFPLLDPDYTLREVYVRVYEPDRLRTPQSGIEHDAEERDCACALEVGPLGVIRRSHEDTLALS